MNDLDSVAEIKSRLIKTIEALSFDEQPYQEDPNMAIMKAVLPELLKNPNSVKTLMELSEETAKKKK